MHNFWKRLTITATLLVLCVIFASAPSIVAASPQLDSPLPNPVAPEPYPNSDIYPAVVYLARESDLRTLYLLNIDIDGLKAVAGVPSVPAGKFQPAIATVYIDPGEAETLQRAGLNPVAIPNEGYRGFLDHGPGTQSPPGWPTFAQYVARMQALADSHSDIVELVSIGTSVQERGLYCLEVTDNPGLDENEPEFKYTANHHGDETTGIEMTMRLAEYLANNYGLDPLITDMVDKMEIWLCPIYNPDGYVNGTRYNAHGVDLNRDFPDRFIDPIDDPTGREPETQAFMNFGYAHRFVMGANYHGGEQVLNYPWDAVNGPPLYAPDDQLFYDFGIGYTSRNPDLWNNPAFPHGITRGWDWYMIYGGMQDWAYYYHGEHHVTIEISWDKNPEFYEMDGFWERNRDAMLWWMQRAWTGMSGEVLDARDNTPLDASLTLVGRGIPNTIQTDPEVGDYHRVIEDGTYTLMATSSGYLSQTADLTVISGTVTTLNFYMCPTDTWVVSGTITDADSGLPIQATVEFAGSRQAASSDPETGYYSISICPASYTMHVFAPWYFPEERQVVIDHDQTQDFALQSTSNLSHSNKQSSTLQALPGDLILYQLHAINVGPSIGVLVTDTLPAEVTWSGELTATQGVPTFEDGHILWQGELLPSEPVTISYSVNVNPCLPAGTSPLNIAEFTDGVTGIITGKVQLEVLNALPSLPTSPSPIDGAINQPILTTLSWAPSSDLNCDVITYDVAFGTSPTPGVVATGLTDPNFDPGILLPGTTYYWRVIARDGLSQVPGPLWSFTTEIGSQFVFLPLTIK